MNKKYKLAELLKNASFLQWIRKEEGADSAQWAEWEQDNAVKQMKRDAQMVDKGIAFKKERIAPDHIKANWKKVAAQIEQKKLATKQAPRLAWRNIAAAIGILLVALGGLYTYSKKANLIEYQTAFGEKETISLPDGTEVILGANSTLSFYDNLASSSNRQVALEGIAFFKVAPQGEDNKFLIGLKDLEVEVVGTEFNINSHRSASIISLIEGKVRLKVSDQQQELTAGQTAFYHPTKTQFEVNHTQTDYWSSWIVGKWSFGKGTSMNEVIQRMEETYGFDITITNPSILNKVASGDISVESQAVLLESLAYLLNLEYYVKDNTLVLSLQEEVED